MASTFNNPLTATDPEGVQASLANSVEKRYRDDHGDIIWTEFETFDPMKAVEPTAHENQLVVALTGLGHRGIGHSTGFELAVIRRAMVIACDKDGERGIRAAKDIEQSGGRIHFVQADVSTEEGVRCFANEIARTADRLDALICNAGAAGDARTDTIRNLTSRRLHELIDANLTSALLTTQAVIEKFFVQQQSGRIVLLGSQNSEKPVLSQLGYGMAKAGLWPLMGSLIVTYGGWLRVNIVRPGPVRTQSVNWDTRLKIDPGWETHEARAISPTGRLTLPEDVARVTAWLATEAPDQLNGVELPVDGGYSATDVLVGTQGRESLVRLGRLLDQLDEEDRKKAA